MARLRATFFALSTPPVTGRSGSRSFASGVRRVLRATRIIATVALALAAGQGHAGEAPAFENPVPATVSPEARAFIAGLGTPSHDPLPDAHDLEGWRRLREDFERRYAGAMAEVLRRYEPDIRPTTLGGVPVLDIRPRGYASDDRVLVFVHGGGYVVGSAASSLTAAVPIAADAGLRVISVDYTLAPAASYDAMVNQVIAVIEALVHDGHRLEHMGVLGVSAGGGLAAGSLLRMHGHGWKLPAALVLWSPVTDLALAGESMVTLGRYEPAFDVAQIRTMLAMVAPPGKLADPVVSPVHGDFTAGYPPTLIQGGTREALLSGFVRLYQAIDTQGGTARLDLYEGMVHAFQEIRPYLPESALARKKSAAFLRQYLDR